MVNVNSKKTKKFKRGLAAASLIAIPLLGTSYVHKLDVRNQEQINRNNELSDKIYKQYPLLKSANQLGDVLQKAGFSIQYSSGTYEIPLQNYRCNEPAGLLAKEYNQMMSTKGMSKAKLQIESQTEDFANLIWPFYLTLFSSCVPLYYLIRSVYGDDKGGEK